MIYRVVLFNVTIHSGSNTTHKYVLHSHIASIQHVDIAVFLL
jgi:hypothetical protein